MPTKKEANKKGGFSLKPINLSTPVKTTDGFTNLVDITQEGEVKGEVQEPTNNTKIKKEKTPSEIAPKEASVKKVENTDSNKVDLQKLENNSDTEDTADKNFRLSESELLRLLDAESLDEIYELSDVLRASSLKLYSTLFEIADERGRVRVKNHELMSKAGIKGIATLYKQERWLMDLRLLEKKAKPGPHDGSSYVVHKLESLPLPAEIFEKFNEYLVNLDR